MNADTEFQHVITADGSYAYDPASPADIARVSKLTGVPIEDIPATPPEPIPAAELPPAILRTPSSSYTYDPADPSDVRRVSRLSGVLVSELAAVEPGESLYRDTEPPPALTPPPPPLRVTAE